MLTDFALGVYGASDRPCEIRDLGKHTEHAVETVATGEGVAVVEAATVLHDAEHGPVEAPIIARLAHGARIGARAADPALPAALAGQPSLIGREVTLSTDADGHVTYSL